MTETTSMLITASILQRQQTRQTKLQLLTRTTALKSATRQMEASTSLTAKVRTSFLTRIKLTF